MNGNNAEHRSLRFKMHDANALSHGRILGLRPLFQNWTSRISGRLDAQTRQGRDAPAKLTFQRVLYGWIFSKVDRGLAAKNAEIPGPSTQMDGPIPGRNGATLAFQCVLVGWMRQA